MTLVNYRYKRAGQELTMTDLTLTDQVAVLDLRTVCQCVYGSRTRTRRRTFLEDNNTGLQ